MPDDKDLSQFQRAANAWFKEQEANEAAKLKVGKLKKKADAWAAQEKADIESGKKKVPLTSNEKAMTEKNKPLKTALVRETEASGSRKDLAGKIRESRNMRLPNEQLSDFQQEVKQYVKFQSAAETGEAQAFVGKMKPGVEQRTQAHALQSREFNYPPANQSKDLGRATANLIRSEAGKADGGSLAKLAKKRQAAGQSIAGKPGNLDGSRNQLSNRLKGIGGKLGMIGVIKGVVEGASTLRKLKTGAYDLTPEGTAKPKKGIVES